MRKRMHLRVASALAGGLLLAACGGGGGGGDVADSGAPEFVSIATGGTGGAYYPIGGAMGSMLADEIDGVRNGTAETTGGSVENLQLLGDQRTEIAMAQNDAIYNAVNGEGDFEEPVDVRTISMMYVNVLQIATTADAGIESFADLAGKNVSVGDQGSATELFMRNVTETLGMSYDDFGEAQRLPFDDQTTAIRNNQLEVGTWVVGPGVSSIQDLASSEDLYLVPFSDEEIQQIVDGFPYYIETEVEAGTYDGLDEGVPAVGTWNTLAMHADADREFVYQVTKAVHENIETLAGAHPSAGEIAAENVENAIAPLHPGAIDYFEEVGAEIPEELYPEEWEEN
ncbi:MAG: TAXI family TRAP transporter solute-binding subunit [Propionibacteriales bacterium]|nr:TAXI family TRAP transporter solute-binding subunit [Propionibacteriales bacterium]